MTKNLQKLPGSLETKEKPVFFDRMDVKPELCVIPNLTMQATPRSLSFRFPIAVLICTFAIGFFGATTMAQDKQPAKKKKKTPAPFKWVNSLSDKEKEKYPNIKHKTFKSASLGVDVGYCLYLPPGYGRAELKEKRYPVVYYLHGGRPGSEKKSIRLAGTVETHIAARKVAPMIYVFVNGGPVSHYNMPGNSKAQGADVFIKELIPHIDATYRTVATREGRGLEGFSQGGRGTARLMFRHPDLFCSASPGGGGHATEKKISESGGYENEKLKFAEGDNTWDLARKYAETLKQPNAKQDLRSLVHVGDKGFNYENNLEWMKHLKSLGIKHEKVIVPGAGHSAQQIYDKHGLDIMQFHAGNFGL